MSYLNSLRLHFAGKFQANVSTVNNDPGHFDNAAFKPSYQQMQGQGPLQMNGWFNPQGDAAWRLLGCKVTAAWMPSGAVSSSDPVLQDIIADSDTMAPAKLVDLDSEQQLVSEIWGLQVRIADANGKTLMVGDYDPAAFMDIWDRAIGNESGGDVDAGAVYQSVLCNLKWGDISTSPFLNALKAAATDGLLSIKFNVDNINMDFTSPDFMCGRIAGTIGPATAAEPRHLVIGRQFMAASSGQGNFFSPAGGINFFPAIVDERAGCIFLDLGNALSTNATTQQPNDLGNLVLTVAGSTTPLGTIPSQGTGGYASDPTWYSRTAGIIALPLTATQLQAIAAAQLTLSSASSASTTISEWTTGSFVRADRYVYRMSPGDSVDVQVYAMQWGKPLSGASITFTADSSQLQPGNYIHPKQVPPVATPLSAIQFSATAPTKAQGLAVMSLKASDPGTPRYFNNGQDYGLDGQVYGIRPSFTDPQLTGGPVNQWDFISLLVWSGFKTAQPVTWSDVEQIFVQYANLYPVMNRFLNLADYGSVVANASLLTLAFGLDPQNPNAMPVTRDLSPAKRQAILSFLANPLPAAQPKRVPPKEERAEAPSPAVSKAARMGGKAAAAGRRILLQKGKKEAKS
jgi:hypothetical protein